MNIVLCLHEIHDACFSQHKQLVLLCCIVFAAYLYKFCAPGCRDRKGFFLRRPGRWRGAPGSGARSLASSVAHSRRSHLPFPFDVTVRSYLALVGPRSPLNGRTEWWILRIRVRVLSPRSLGIYAPHTVPLSTECRPAIRPGRGSEKGPPTLGTWGSPRERVLEADSAQTVDGEAPDPFINITRAHKQ